jgi:hypothetical protein
MTFSCEHGNEPYDSVKGGDLLDNIGNIGVSKRTLLHGVNYVHCKGYCNLQP